MSFAMRYAPCLVLALCLTTTLGQVDLYESLDLLDTAYDSGLIDVDSDDFSSDAVGMYIMMSNDALGSLLNDAASTATGSIKDYSLDGFETTKDIFGEGEWKTQFTIKDFKIASVSYDPSENEVTLMQPGGFKFTLKDVAVQLDSNYDVFAPHASFPGSSNFTFSKLVVDVTIQIPKDTLVCESVEIVEAEATIKYEVSNKVWENILNLLATNMESLVQPSMLDAVATLMQGGLQEALEGVFPTTIPISSKINLDVSHPEGAFLAGKDRSALVMPVKGAFYSSGIHPDPSEKIAVPKFPKTVTDQLGAYVSDYTIESYFVVSAIEEPLTTTPTPFQLLKKPLTAGSDLVAGLFPVVKDTGKGWSTFDSSDVLYLSISNKGCDDATASISEKDYITLTTPWLLSVYVQTGSSSKDLVEAVTIRVPIELQKLELEAKDSTLSFSIGALNFVDSFQQIHSSIGELDVELMQSTWQTYADLLVHSIQTIVDEVKIPIQGVTFSQVDYQENFVVVSGSFESQQFEQNFVKVNPTEETDFVHRTYGQHDFSYDL